MITYLPRYIKMARTAHRCSSHVPAKYVPALFGEAWKRQEALTRAGTSAKRFILQTFPVSKTLRNRNFHANLGLRKEYVHTHRYLSFILSRGSIDSCIMLRFLLKFIDIEQNYCLTKEVLAHTPLRSGTERSRR